jgi:hypothetical protein
MADDVIDVGAAASQASQLNFGDFIDKVVAEATVDEPVTDEAKVIMKEDMLKQLNTMINARLITEMSDEQVEEFRQLLDTKPTSEQIQEFTAKVVADPGEFLSQVMLDYRREYLGLV